MNHGVKSIFVSVVLLMMGMSVFPVRLAAVGEIQIEGASITRETPEKFKLSTSIKNTTADTREVTLRFQIFFFEQISPKGDKPAMVLRKDETIVLKQGEQRSMIVTLWNEGSLPKGNLRMEPEVRLRRQRVWSY